MTQKTERAVQWLAPAVVFAVLAMVWRMGYAMVNDRVGAIVIKHESDIRATHRRVDDMHAETLRMFEQVTGELREIKKAIKESGR